MATPQPRLTRFEHVRNLVVAGVLALGFSLTLAIYAEATYARPHCLAWATARQLTYAGLEYPSAPPGIPGRRVATCLLLDSRRTLVTVPFADVAPHRVSAVLVDVTTTPLVTTPLLVLVFVAGLFRVYAALGVKR